MDVWGHLLYASVCAHTGDSLQSKTEDGQSLMVPMVNVKGKERST